MNEYGIAFWWLWACFQNTYFVALKNDEESTIEEYLYTNCRKYGIQLSVFNGVLYKYNAY